MVTIFINCGICHSKLESDHGKSSPEDSLEAQLNTVFLLRHIFKFNPSQLETYLKKWGNPGDWFKLCQGCEAELIQIRRSFEKLNEISREIKRRRYEFQERLQLQHENRTPGIAEILHECYRHQERIKHSNQPEFHPFENGDRLASDLALKLKKEMEEIDYYSDGDGDLASQSQIFPEDNTEKSSSDEFEDGDSDQDGYFTPSYNHQRNESTSEVDVDVEQSNSNSKSRRRRRRRCPPCPKSRKPKIGRPRTRKYTRPHWKILNCPVCSTRFTLGKFIQFSEHLQRCVPTFTLSAIKSLTLTCSMCKKWSCPSNRIREFLEHTAFCREDHKPGITVVPWRHALMKCSLCQDPKYKYLTLPDFAIHINKYHQHKYHCTQCPYRSHKSFQISKDHWRRHHKDLLDTPVEDRYQKDAEGTILPLPEIPWWCPASECLQKFSDEADRDPHLNNCNEFKDMSLERSEKCTFCGRDYFSSEELLMHRVTMHGYLLPRDYECKECHIFFENSESLRGHQRREHNMNLFRCKECNEEFFDPNVLRRHVRREHGIPEKPKQFTCHLCAKSYVHDYQLRLHINKVHEGKFKRKCNYCELEFIDRPALRAHVTSAHPEIEEESHPCPKEGCEEVFRTSIGLKMHLTGFHSKFAKIFTCQVCQRKFRSEHNYKTHVKAGCQIPSSSKSKIGTREMRKRSSKVQKSEKRSKTQVQVAKRKRQYIHKGLVKHRLQCDLCGNTLQHYEALKRHKAEVHGLGDYPCEGEGCSRTFSSRGLMLIHKKVVHDKVREFTCSFCGKRLSCNWKLRHHEDAMHRNKDSKPFKCHICEKTFATNTYLIYHYKHTHKIPKGKVSLAEKEKVGE